MANMGTMRVNLVANTAAFEKGMRRSRKQLGFFQSSVVSAKRILGNFGAIIGGIGAGMAIKRMIQNTAEAEETLSKFKAVFKEQANAADAFAKKFSAAIGRSIHDTRKYMSTFQDTLVPMGLAREEAAKFAERLVELTYDLSSFNNEMPVETAKSLQSALVGNHETVRRYGVVIMEANLKQRMFAKGLDKLSGAAEQKAKMLERFNMIVEGTKDAQGDALRTAGSLTNQWRRLTSQAHDLSVELGTNLVPVLNNLLKAMNALPKMAFTWQGPTKTQLRDMEIGAMAMGPERLKALRAEYGKVLQQLMRFHTKQKDFEESPVFRAAQARMRELQKQIDFEAKLIKLHKQEAVAVKEVAQQHRSVKQILQDIATGPIGDIMRGMGLAIPDLSRFIQGPEAKVKAAEKGEPGGVWSSDIWRDAVSAALGGGTVQDKIEQNTGKTKDALERIEDKLDTGGTTGMVFAA